MAEVTRYWWLRHAPSIGGGLIGATDAAADVGNAHALAGRLPASALVLSSGMRRARQTLAALGLREAAAVPALCEQDFGLWEGLGWDDINVRYPVEAARFWADPADARPPGGESFADVAGRVRAWLSAPSAPGDVVIVAHAGPIRAALAEALDLSPAAALRFEVGTLSLTRIDRLHVGDEVHWRVAGVNVTAPDP